MSNRFMVSVAALALLAGTGLANAQGMQGGKNESGGSTMQHSTGNSAGQSRSEHSTTGEAKSSEKGGMKSESSEKGGMKASQSEQKGGMKEGQSEQKSPGAMKKQNAEENTKSGKAKQRAEERNKGSQTNQRAEERNKGTQTNQRAEERNKSGQTIGQSKTTGQSNMNAQSREKNGTGNSAAESNTLRSQSTTGQAGAGAKLTTDQRTKITTVFRNEHVQPENNVNFSIAVGTRVPREHVHFYPLPAQVVSIYPEWRGYEFIRVHDQILVVDPHTYEIVAILEA